MAPRRLSLSVSVAFDGLNSTSLDTEVGTTFNYINNLTMVRGRHTLKAGVEIRRIRLNNSGNTLTTQSISYAYATDFINNAATSATWLQGEGVVGNRRTFAMGYFQDDFKVSPELTLNLGLRYEFYSVAHEILNRSAVVDILGCGGFCPKGHAVLQSQPDGSSARASAWPGRPHALHGKTTIRSGFGIYYGGNQNDDFSDPAESAVPRYSWSSSDTPTLSYPLTPFLNPAIALFSPKAIDRHRKDLSYNNYDFVVQQDVGRGFIAQVGYVGGEGHHLFDKYTVNLINPATGKRTLSAFGSFGLKANDGNNNFNALQASLQRRFFRGLLFQANYMWSHGIADASTAPAHRSAFRTWRCRACDRSNSPRRCAPHPDHQRRLGVALRTRQAVSHQRPGFQDSGRMVALRPGHGAHREHRSTSRFRAKPRPCRTATLPASGPTWCRAPPIYAATRSIPTVWFNPAAFSTPANGTWGNLGRYIGSGPNNYEIDGGLQKRFRLTERANLNFRASAFNLLNNPQWSQPLRQRFVVQFRADHQHPEHRRNRHGRPAPRGVHAAGGILGFQQSRQYSATGTRPAPALSGHRRLGAAAPAGCQSRRPALVRPRRDCVHRVLRHGLERREIVSLHRHGGVARFVAALVYSARVAYLSAFGMFYAERLVHSRPAAESSQANG